MKNLNFAPKDVQEFSSHKISKRCMNRRCSVNETVFKNFRIFTEKTPALNITWISIAICIVIANIKFVAHRRI